MKNRWLCFLFLIFGVTNLYSQTAKYSNEFLALGIGARGLAMSHAVGASTNDIYSTYWNPAGLMGINAGKSLAFMHAEYFAGIAKYDYGAFATRAGKNSALAFSLIRFAVDNIPNTSQLIDAEGNINYDKVTSFSSADYAFTISYAHRTSIDGLSYGLNTRIIRRVAGDFASSWGFGIDLGAIYKKKNWSFGAMFRDVTTTYNSWNYTFSDEMINVFLLTGNDIPKSSTEITLPSLTLAAGRKFILGKNFSILTELNAKITSDGKRNVLVVGDPFSIDPSFGTEIGFKEIIFLRAGIGNFQNETVNHAETTTFQPNIGLGIVIKRNLAIDYALTDIGNQSIALYSNVFTIKLSFNSKSQKDKI
ncbi:MAG: hypothetical protein JXR34_09700 [Bacteroidales bacterium]|nr:hypothetical protein [Bacteroidales bacterium]